MKKQVLELININLKRLNGAKSTNALDSDAATLVDDAITSLQQLKADTEAQPEVVGMDAVMEKVRAIIDEKIAAALEKVKDIAEPVANYLASKNAVRDFAQCLRTNRNADDFRAAWRAVLAKNSVAIDGGSEEGYLPELVKSRIEDAWNSKTNWLNSLNNTGAKRFAIRFSDQEQDNVAVRAKGHQRGAKKTEQEVTLQAKVVSLQAIYKLQKIDKITEFEDDGQLIDWLVDELTRQMYYEIGRAILVGDGRQAGDPDQITSFEAVNRATTDTFVTVGTYGSYGDIVEEVMEALVSPLYNDGGDIVLFMGKADLFALRKFIPATGATTRYASIDEVKSMLGVRDIITVPYLDSTTSAGPRMIALRPDKYYTVGKMTDFNFVRFPDYMTNEEYFRSETFAGGAPGMNAGAVLLNA